MEGGEDEKNIEPEIREDQMEIVSSVHDNCTHKLTEACTGPAQDKASPHSIIDCGRTQSLRS